MIRAHPLLLFFGQRWIAFCGLLGPIILLAYFVIPFFVGWPFGGATPDVLRDYATTNATFFYAGAWLQAIGTVLCVVFFLGLVSLTASVMRPAGLAVIVASTTLLCLVLVEGVFMVTVPQAASAGDLATVATAFTLSNGAFTRAFAAVPAPATYIAIGVMLRGSALLGSRFAMIALALGCAFEVAAVAAIVSPAGIVIAIVLSAAQSLWIVAAALALMRRAAPSSDSTRSAPLARGPERSGRAGEP